MLASRQHMLSYCYTYVYSHPVQYMIYTIFSKHEIYIVMRTQKYLLNALSLLKQILRCVKGSGNQQTSSGSQENRTTFKFVKDKVLYISSH